MGSCGYLQEEWIEKGEKIDWNSDLLVRVGAPLCIIRQFPDRNETEDLCTGDFARGVDQFGTVKVERFAREGCAH